MVISKDEDWLYPSRGLREFSSKEKVQINHVGIGINVDVCNLQDDVWSVWKYSKTIKKV